MREWEALAAACGFEVVDFALHGLSVRLWQRERDGLVDRLTPPPPDRPELGWSVGALLQRPLCLFLHASSEQEAVEEFERQPVEVPLGSPWRVIARDVPSARELIVLLAPILQNLTEAVTLSDTGVSRRVAAPPDPAGLERVIAALRELADDVEAARAALGPTGLERALVEDWRTLQRDGWLLDAAALRLDLETEHHAVRVELDFATDRPGTNVLARWARPARGGVALFRPGLPDEIVAFFGIGRRLVTGDAVFDAVFEARVPAAPGPRGDPREVLGPEVRAALLSLPPAVGQVFVGADPEVDVRLVATGLLGSKDLRGIVAVLERIRPRVQDRAPDATPDPPSAVNVVGSLVALLLMGIGAWLLLS